MIENYGVENCSQSDIIKDKKIQSSLKHFKTKYPNQSQIIKDKTKQTNLEKYGVEYSIASPEIRKKSVETHIKKYGYAYSFQNPEIREKAKNVCLEKFGVEYYFQDKDLWNKAFEKLCENPYIYISKEENKFYQFLLEIFEKDDIIRQKKLKNWVIDFYIISINIYIQFDGLYWHGLDRPIENIINSKTKRDNFILKKMQSDKKQEIYCNDNNIILIRILENFDKQQTYDFFVKLKESGK